MNLGEKCQTYLLALAKHSETGPGLTRLYLTAEHRDATQVIEKWMQTVGFKTKIDQFGNLVGAYDGGNNQKPTLILASHQDSVIHGGIYDGMLGIVAPLIALSEIGLENLDFNLKIIAFGDEEGVRFGTTYLGSKAITGSITPALLEMKDDKGITLYKALKAFGLDPDKKDDCMITDEHINYFEVHIEQGTVLEKENQAVGIVDGIQASKRFKFTIHGHAGHAGNLPMHLRQDAGIVMAEIMVFINEIANQEENLVATIGQIQLNPNAINVVPEQAVFSLDIRSPKLETIEQACHKILNKLEKICQSHQTSYDYETIAKSTGVSFSQYMQQKIENAILKKDIKPIHIYSGAGHDAQEMSKIAQAGMLFVRCKGGVSHHPDEYVKPEDLDAAVKVIIQFLHDY